MYPNLSLYSSFRLSIVLSIYLSIHPSFWLLLHSLFISLLLSLHSPPLSLYPNVSLSSSLHSSTYNSILLSPTTLTLYISLTLSSFNTSLFYSFFLSHESYLGTHLDPSTPITLRLSQTQSRSNSSQTIYLYQFLFLSYVFFQTHIKTFGGGFLKYRHIDPVNTRMKHNNGRKALQWCCLHRDRSIHIEIARSKNP